MEKAQAGVELHERLVEHALVHVAHADEPVHCRTREHRVPRPPRQLELEANHRGAAHLRADDQHHRAQEHRDGREAIVWRARRQGTTLATSVLAKKTMRPTPSACVWKKDRPASTAKTARPRTSSSYSAEPESPCVCGLAATRAAT